MVGKCRTISHKWEAAAKGMTNHFIFLRLRVEEESVASTSEGPLISCKEAVFSFESLVLSALSGMQFH